MKKIVFVFLISLITIPLILTRPLLATDTRAKGIGLLDPAKDRWMIDGILTYTYNNPVYIGVYRNRLFMEYNTSNNYVGGLMISASRKIHIGIFSGFEIDSDVFGSVDPYLSMFDVTGASGTYNGALSSPGSIGDQYFTFMMAFDIRNFSIGIKFGWAGAMDSVENKATDVNSQLSAHALLIGVGSLVKFKRSLSLEVNPDVNIYLIDNYVDNSSTGAKSTFASDGAMDFCLPVRINYNVSYANTLHFLIGFKYVNRSTKGKGALGSGSDKWERVAYDLFFGISDEWRVHQNVFILAGLQLDWFGKTYKYSVSTVTEKSEDVLIIPIHLGLEGNLPKNWIVRCGLKHNLITYTKEVDKSNAAGDVITTSLNSSNLNGAMGLSWNIGNLTFEWNVNIVIFRAGPHFISGQSNNFSTDFALSYVFDRSMPSRSRGRSRGYSGPGKKKRK